ncbi:MAG: hypothetical protein EPO28_10675 [Saprospiraceae bacterium]|nr:MAG: hypothetical protein EPO28_10675 [Saprospiraceae bacterium]
MNQEQDFPFFELPFDGCWLQPYPIHVIEGYEAPENFPNCCDFHQSVVRLTQDWYENKFPDCCDKHREMSKRTWFQKEYFKDIATKVVTQLAYTQYHVSKRIDAQNWFEDITAYIDANICWSFGSPEVGASKYLQFLRHFIEHEKPIDWVFPDEKRQKLIDHLNREENPPKNTKEDTDLNLLYQTFQKWLATFPDLDFFMGLKAKHKGKIPMNLFLYDTVFNPYTGMSKSSTRTQTELIEVLLTLTKQILDEIDTTALIEAGSISNANEYKYQLARESHRLKQSRLVGNFTEGEKNYRQLLETWLVNEKAYFDEIEPLFNKVPQLSNTTKEQPQIAESNKPTQPQIALLYRYLLQANIEQPITVASRNSIAEKYGFTAPTSGQKIYDWFNKLNTPSQRTTKGKYTVKNLEVVISFLDNYPTAKTIAEEELKIARRDNQ